MTTEEKLADLALELFNAKKAEDKAKESRINIEQEIINTVVVDENQSKTFKAGELKLTVKKELSYAVDQDNLFGAGLISAWLESIFERVPETFKFKPSDYEKMHETNPEAFKAISPYVSVKPKKTSVTLKF